MERELPLRRTKNSAGRLMSGWKYFPRKCFTRLPNPLAYPALARPLFDRAFPVALVDDADVFHDRQ
jgi:hypothetical protein